MTSGDASVCQRGARSPSASNENAWAAVASLCAAMAFFPTDALARRCTDESVRLATAPSGSAESALPESTGALLHHQPTAAEVAAAEIEDEKRKSDALDRARELDLDGKEAACLAALREISHSDNDALARRRLASQPHIRKICRVALR
jgi:hypothetical protein